MRKKRAKAKALRQKKNDDDADAEDEEDIEYVEDVGDQSNGNVFITAEDDKENLIDTRVPEVQPTTISLPVEASDQAREG